MTKNISYMQILFIKKISKIVFYPYESYRYMKVRQETFKLRNGVRGHRFGQPALKHRHHIN